MSVTISITGSETLRDAQRQLDLFGRTIRNPRPLTEGATEGVKDAVQEHFRSLNLSRHRAEAPRPGFYAIARESTIAAVASDEEGSVAVTGPDGIAQRYFGGTIKAKPGRYLAIPVVPEMTGIRAREVYERLGLIRIVNQGTGKGVLLDPSGKVIYALTRQVTQRPDRTVLPSPKTMTEAGVQAALITARAIVAAQLHTQA